MLDHLTPCLLQSLPGYLHTFADFRSLILASRTLYTYCSEPTAKELLRLATNPETDLQPYPHLLLAVKARALSTYSSQSTTNLSEFHDAIKKGPEEVLNLALKVSPLTKADLQNLYNARRQVIDPLSDILEPQCGPPIDLPHAFTVCDEVTLALINYWIYCELFSTTIEAQYRKCDRSVQYLPSASVRRNWFVFCVPDENTRILRKYPYPGDVDEGDDDESDDDEEPLRPAYDPAYDRSNFYEALALSAIAYQSLDLKMLMYCIDEKFTAILNKIIPKLPRSSYGRNELVTQNIAANLGIDSFRLLLPGAEDRPMPKRVKEVIEAYERGEVKDQPFIGRGWHSFRTDLDETFLDGTSMSR